MKARRSAAKASSPASRADPGDPEQRAVGDPTVGSRPWRWSRFERRCPSAPGERTSTTFPATTVGEVLRELERRHPPIVGWILDEQGRVRPHVNVFVNGERITEDVAVAPADVLHVLPSISGG